MGLKTMYANDIGPLSHNCFQSRAELTNPIGKLSLFGLSGKIAIEISQRLEKSLGTCRF